MKRILAIYICFGVCSSFLFNNGPLEVYVTCGDGSKKLSPEPSLNSGSGSGTRINVDRSKRYQTMDGFGAALTNSAAYVIYHSPRRHEIMRSLFGWNGIGISYVRLTMGGSDFQAVNAYTYDDLPDNNQNDFGMNRFSIDKDKAFVIPILKEALTLNPKLKVMATPWSAPAWMKNNKNLFGGDFNSGSQYQEAYASYFVKFIQAYASEGIKIEAITVQNEPLHKSDSYPTMGMSWQLERDFIKYHLGPKFRSNGINTKILIFDHNWDLKDYPEHIMSDSSAAQYIDGSAWHCYGGRHDTPESFHNKFPSKNIYFTECSGGDWDTNYYDGIVWNFRILMIGQPRSWAKSVLLFNLALDDNHGPRQGVSGCKDCRGVLTVHGDGSFTKNFEYMYIGHMSKVVQPGAVRVDSSWLGWDSLQSVAFENPDRSVAAVVLNPTASDQQIHVDIDGTSYPYNLKAHCVASFLKRH
ncbi:hypothetical protein FSP39_008702 [Pinctada imbricata]|uniref:Glucosylceramidase n=1 Tax=Pinctada imbricata TaxID=66713 RepID=A0AA89BUA2_PINIB|nr:hypothetical protein FSP39_008702 [Pinctada imbricata]